MSPHETCRVPFHKSGLVDEMIFLRGCSKRNTGRSKKDMKAPRIEEPVVQGEYYYFFTFQAN